MKYRTAKNTNYRSGILADISTSGAMIWIKDSLQIGDEVEVVMQSELDPKPVHMHMHVVRIIKNPRENFIGYGCKLKTQEPWETL